MRQFALAACLVLSLTIVAPVIADTPPPGLMFSTVLNGLKFEPRTSELWLYQIQATFLPDAESSSINKYDPNDGGKLWAILAKTDDDGEQAELFRYDFYGEELKEPFWLLSSYRWTDLATEESGGGGGRQKLEPGSYTLDFHLESGKFYSYPFTITKPGGDSFIEGDWNDWGYIYYRDADPDQNIQWKVWLRQTSPEANLDTKIRIGVMRESENNKLVATARPNRSHTLRHEWVRYEFDLIEPMQGTSGGRQLQAKDILVDGDYVLKMVVNDETYGLWRFTVQGGKLTPAGRAVRGEADPLTFVEGGKDAFWYGRSE